MNSLLRIVGLTLLAFSWMPVSVLGHKLVDAWVEAVGLRSMEGDGPAYSSVRWSILLQVDLTRSNAILYWGNKNIDQQTKGKDLPEQAATVFFSILVLDPEEFTPPKPWQFIGQAAVRPRAPCWLS